MKYLIRQDAGLGDILYCQKLCTVLKENTGGEIIWPITKEYLYLPEYIKNNFQYCSADVLSKSQMAVFNSPVSDICEFIDDETNETIVYIPLGESYKTHPTISVMESKYSFVNISPNDWANYFEITRNYEREEKLLNHLKIDKTSKFNLVNLTFGTYPNTATYNKEIKISNSYPTIKMEFLGWDRIFDWIPVFELAHEIHTVNTSICYILEKLNIQGKLLMYCRNQSDMYRWYTPKMYRKDWNYIEYD